MSSIFDNIDQIELQISAVKHCILNYGNIIIPEKELKLYVTIYSRLTEEALIEEHYELDVKKWRLRAEAESKEERDKDRRIHELDEEFVVAVF